MAHVDGPLATALKGMEVADQEAIDGKMIEVDGTANKARLGANAILAASLCVARVASYEHNKGLFRYLREDLGCPTGGRELCLPTPLMNIINGGCHAANNLDIQEFMIVPHLDASFGENLRAAVEVFHHLKQVLTEGNFSINVGDEGGFAPHLDSHQQAVELILEAIERAHYRPGEDISLALDCAANEFYRHGCYQLGGESLSSRDMIAYLKSLVEGYPIYSIEDGLAEDDHQGWRELTSELGGRVVLVGDDLFATNCQLLQQGIASGEANAILVKPNQIGTLTETLRTMEVAAREHYRVIVSHRSGETEDDFIADLATATSCGHIKAGSASRSDRLAKYNQLLRIAQELGGESAPYHRVERTGFVG